MFNFVILLMQISTERELRLRAALNLMGLRVSWCLPLQDVCLATQNASPHVLQDSVYWSSWMITYIFLQTWTVLFLIAFGAAFQFSFFLDNNFGTYFFLIELSALSLIPASFLASVFVKKSAGASTFPPSHKKQTISFAMCWLFRQT